MKLLVTLILAGSILCLSVVIGTINRIDAVKVSGRTALVGVADALAAEELIVEKQGQRVRMVKRSDNFWMFAEPTKDVMDAVAVRNLLSKIGNLTILETISSKELKRPEMALSKLGLDKDNELIVRLKIPGKNKKNTERVFSIGAKAPRADSVYIRDGGKKDSPICVIDGNVLPILESPDGYLRERRLVTLPLSSLVQTVVKSNAGEYTLQRNISKDGASPWQLSKPVLAKADQKLVGAMLDDVLNLQLSGEVVEGALPIPEQLPEGAFVFQFWHIGAKKPEQLYLQPIASTESPSDYHAVVSSRPNQLFSHYSNIGNLVRTANQLRDRRIGTIPESVLASIGILPNKIIIKAVHKENFTDYEVLFNDRFVPADNQKVKALIAQLSDNIIIDFIDGGDPKKYNLGMIRLGFNFVVPPSNPNNTSTKPEEITKTIDFGFTTDENGRRRLYGSWVNEPQIFELEEGFAALLPLEVVKWRSPRVTLFSHLRIESIKRDISQSVRGGESLNIKYDSSRGITGFDGDNNPVVLDPGASSQLRKEVAALKASEWVFNTAVALELLKEPDAVFTLNVRENDPATGTFILKPYELKFVEGPNGTIFGQFDGADDVFTITPSFFRKLIQPLNNY